MHMKHVQFLDWNCVELTNGSVTLRVTQSAGPRIIYLALPGGDNILAEVPDFVIPPPIGGPFRIIGGHRVWHGPEKEQRSYLPDDIDPVEITPVEGGVCAVQKTDAAGIQKMMDIRLAPDRAQVTVTNILKNENAWPIETYPWGLTQVRPGGWGILPQPTEPLDRYALIPNRSLALWAYTHINDPRLQLGDRYTFVQADPNNSDSFKIGYANRRGWLGYYLDGTVLLESAPYQADGRYPDFGCSSEIYANDRFMELEFMGPLTMVEPGELLSLPETWTLFAGVDLAPDEDQVDRWVKDMRIDE